MKIGRVIALCGGLCLTATGGTWAASDSWKFDSSTDPIRDEARALVYFDSENRNAPQIAFKCQAGKMPYMILGFISPAYDGKAERLRVYIKVDGVHDFQVGVAKLFERGVSPYLLYSGVEAEVHKLWFLSNKIISYRTQGERKHNRSLVALLAALRDGQTHLELSFGHWRGLDRSDRKITTIPLRGSTRAINKFIKACALHY